MLNVLVHDRIKPINRLRPVSAVLDNFLQTSSRCGRSRCRHSRRGILCASKLSLLSRGRTLLCRDTPSIKSWNRPDSPTAQQCQSCHPAKTQQSPTTLREIKVQAFPKGDTLCIEIVTVESWSDFAVSLLAAMKDRSSTCSTSWCTTESNQSTVSGQSVQSLIFHGGQ
jgi:hypothetical protein